MKKLVRNIILLAGILFLINYVMHVYYLPFSWGDKDLHTKLTFYEANKDDYNALFIGGSLVYRHVNPEITDSIAHLNGFEFHSFNAGGDGIAFLNQVRILEDILSNPSPNLEYAFLSLSSTARFRYLNLHTKRFTTWQRPIDMVRAIRVSMAMPAPLKVRLKTSWFYVIAAAENSLNIGLMNDAIQYLTYPEQAYTSTSLGMANNGFFPYDLQEQLVYEKGTEEYNLQEAMILSHEVYEREIEKRDSITRKIANEFKNYDPDAVIEPMLNIYKKMIKRCEEKGIKLIIILQPKTRESYDYLIPVYDQLPATNKINLGDPAVYPEFYEPENCYNYHHLNLKGANIFSEILAYKILNLEGIPIQEENSIVNENQNP
ncbi:MAG: hypothetical protein R2728_11490 [Chitinophagales bacterium]